jgi:hypothetical protein
MKEKALQYPVIRNTRYDAIILISLFCTAKDGLKAKPRLIP